jgi:hypothetical protein
MEFAPSSCARPRGRELLLKVAVRPVRRVRDRLGFDQGRSIGFELCPVDTRPDATVPRAIPLQARGGARQVSADNLTAAATRGVGPQRAGIAVILEREARSASARSHFLRRATPLAAAVLALGLGLSRRFAQPARLVRRGLSGSERSDEVGLRRRCRRSLPTASSANATAARTRSPPTATRRDCCSGS